MPRRDLRTLAPCAARVDAAGVRARAVVLVTSFGVRHSALGDRAGGLCTGRLGGGTMNDVIIGGASVPPPRTGMQARR